MLITSNTKVSNLINYDSKIIEIISSINPLFRKLKNPILRRTLARRVKISDAAKIGGISVEEFLKVLHDNGYQVNFNNSKVNKSNNSNYNTEEIKLTNMNRLNIVELDVRPILKGGVDPFEAIMDKLKIMTDDQTLLIINTFEPVPLLNILKNKGYSYETERPEEGVVYTYLSKCDDSKKNNVHNKEFESELSFEDAEKKYSGIMNEVDVRDLEMPLPMVTILQELEKVNESHALYVHHKQLPQYLLPELSDRGYKYVHQTIDEDNLKLIIFK